MDLASAKRSTCYGAGAGVYFFLLQRNLSEITDVGVCGLSKFDASWTRLFCSVPPSPRGKGQVPSLPPRDSTLASDGHHPSAVPEAVKYIHSPTLCLGCTLEGF